MFKNSKQMVPIAIQILFTRDDQYHNYNTRQGKSLDIQDFLVSWSKYMELSIKTYSI